MNRKIFVTSSALATAGLLTAGAARATTMVVGGTTTQQALLAGLPPPQAGQWVRLILGTGVAYQKQIGLATEATETRDLAYVETQVGLPGGSCNPNTMKRAYVRGSTFGGLLAPQPVVADVSDSGTTLTRYSDIDGGQTQQKGDATLRLLDVGYVYDDRRVRIVSSKTETLQLPAAIAYAGPEDASRGALSAHPTTHTVVEFVGPADAKHLLTRAEYWTTPAVPFGIAKFRAYPKGLEPFDMHVYSYGTGFKSNVSMTLKTIRAMTPDGTYVNAN